MAGRDGRVDHELLINARCNAQGEPVIYAFSSSRNADLFGRFYDGLGRLHIVSIG